MLCSSLFFIVVVVVVVADVDYEVINLFDDVEYLDDDVVMIIGLIVDGDGDLESKFE